MTKYFVWLSGLRGPEAQILYDIPTDGNNKSTLKPLFEQRLTADEEKLSLDELALKFKSNLPDGA